MGFLTRPSTTSVDPTPESVQALQPDITAFLGDLFGGGTPFAGMTSDLQRQSTDAISAFLGADPEGQTMNQLMPGLMEIFGGGTAEGIGQAALPVFQRELQRSLGGLSSGAPGRFGTAFASQGIDLASRSAQDFAMLEAQAREREVANRLGAAGLMGSLQNQSFNQMLGAGQLGLAQTQAAINPQLQMLLGGLQFGRPSATETIVGQSPLQGILGGASALIAGGGVGGILEALMGGGGIPQAPGVFPSPDPGLVMGGR